MSRARKIIKRTLITLVSLAIVGGLYLSWWSAGLLVNKPIAQRYDFCSGDARFCVAPMLDKFGMSEDKVEVSLTSFDGTQLKGLYFPSKNGAAVIVQHGYGGHRGAVMHIAHMLYQQGFGVVTMDLRAHGKSGGELVTFGRDESKDMQFVFDFLKNRAEVDPEKIGIYGWSLGGATVLLHGALNNQVKAVVADSPFDAINIENMQEFTDAFWPLPSLIKYFSSVRSGVDFEQEAPIAHLETYQNKPLFVLIAGADTVVEAGSGERLVEAINNPNVQIWREPTFGHVRFSFDAPEKFATDVGAFFAKHLQPNQIVVAENQQLAE